MRLLTPEEREEQKRMSTSHWWATNGPKRNLLKGVAEIVFGVAVFSYIWILSLSYAFSGILLILAGIAFVIGGGLVYTGVHLIVGELLDWYKYVRKKGVGEA